MMNRVFRGLIGFVLLGCSTCLVYGWDYAAHRTINKLALATLPAEFPAFVKTPAATERIAFLAGEPDRWRNSEILSLKHGNGPDHYIDVEELGLYGLKAEALPVFRYDFVADLALVRKEDPKKFAAALAGRNDDHTREVVGLLPWAMAEMYGKLQSGFSYLKAYQEDGGTSEEIANAQANIIYIMGVMGHFFGDASQPLHTTIHHHGWTGPNPSGYSTARTIHSWIDGGFFEKTGGLDLDALIAKTRPAHLAAIGEHPAQPEEMFQVGMLFIIDQHKKVEPLYQLEKEGKFSPNSPPEGEGRVFLEGQLLKSAQFLGDIWITAWRQAPPDGFLKNQLARRAGTTLSK